MKKELKMKRLIMAACSASLLMLGTSAFAQSSGAMGNNSMSKGAMAASEPMAASGTMAKKPMKHQKKMMKKEDGGMGMGNHASGTSAN
ncbi:pentapeptide MXKDX repeat protein [Paraburkholderia sp. UCT31]|uniref:pentapeptide MXKDX repeat protein n=1 Tax=unclassified Paraburkholderia TaxID=2615204 RepID=UPI00223B9CE5|nr:pentapeptide MXKDX repeat protein [Paraburkholderia sp. UCT31]